MAFFCLTAILLGSVKVPYEEIKRRIVEIDEDQLSSHMIEQLIQYMPSPDQMSQIAGLKDEYSTLAESEQFAVVVSWKGRKGKGGGEREKQGQGWGGQLLIHAIKHQQGGICKLIQYNYYTSRAPIIRHKQKLVVIPNQGHN